MDRKLLILLDKTIFHLLFYIVVLFNRLRRKEGGEYYLNFEGNEHFLVIRPGGLGDGIMSVPLLRALRERFPDGRITVLCMKKTKAALQNLPFHDDLIVFDDLKNFPRNVFFLIRNRIAVVFDLEQFRRITSVVAYLSGTPVRVGFDTNDRRLLYTHLVTYRNDSCFESANMVRQLEVLGIRLPFDEAVDLGFSIPDEVKEKASFLLRSQEIDPKKDFVVAIFPGVLKPHHRWRMSEFAFLIDKILIHCEETKIILLGSQNDIPDTNEVLGYLEGASRVISFVGKTSYLEALGLLNACKILIACDGGPVYMAASMGCRTISLWGPGVMDRFKPPGKLHAGIKKDYFCIPCVNYSRLGEFPECPYDRKCMNDITADNVFHKYMEMKAALAP